MIKKLAMTANIGNKKIIKRTSNVELELETGTELEFNTVVELEFNTSVELFNIAVEFKSNGM